MVDWPPILRARRGFPLPSLRITIVAATLSVTLPAVIAWLTTEPLFRAALLDVPPHDFWMLLYVAVALWRLGLVVSWFAVPLGAHLCRSLARRGWDGLPVALLVGAAMSTALFLIMIVGPNLWFDRTSDLVRLLPLLGMFLFSALSHAALYWTLLRTLDRRARKSC